VPLQQVATDALKLPFKEIRPQLKKFTGPTITKIKIPKKKYIIIAPHSTCQAKYWINSRWNEVITYLHKIGYGVISLAKEPNELDNVTWVENPPIRITLFNM